MLLRLIVLALTLLSIACGDSPTSASNPDALECTSETARFEPTDKWVRIYVADGSGRFVCMPRTFKDRGF